MPDMARKLQSWRKRLGITQIEAAELLDMPRRTYEGWEAGRNIDRWRILELALKQIETEQKR